MLRRSLASLTDSLGSYKVVILGGGTAGITIASQLSKHQLFKNKKDILVIEPNASHYYQPLWTLVGAGLKTLNETQRPTESLVPRQADWLQHAVTKVDPNTKVVVTDKGAQIKYDYLVCATGINLDWHKVAGLAEALGQDGVSSNYDVNSVEQTFKNIREFKGGNAVFTQPSTPIKCAGAPQKIAYLAEEAFRQNGVRDNSQVSFFSGMGKIFAIDKYANRLLQVCAERDIGVNLLWDLKELRADKKQAVFKHVQDGNTRIVDYDMIHVTPPMSPPGFIAESGLGDAAGWVDVDKETTQHNKYPSVFALGDSSSLPTSKTAAAVAAQSAITSSNLISAIKGEELAAKYDGYTSCPLVTGKNKLILAEFSGYTGQPKETFFFDQSQERSFSYYLKSEAIPFVYWNLMMHGNWSGPAPYRPILNPLQKN